VRPFAALTLFPPLFPPDPLQGVFQVKLLADTVTDQSPKHIINEPTASTMAILDGTQPHPPEFLPQSRVSCSSDQGFKLLHEGPLVGIEDMRVDETANFLE
jgi:hypothetical protein